MSDILLILGALGALGTLATAIAILLKVGVEKTDVKIETADKVMIGQDRFVDQLQEQLNAALARIAAVEKTIEVCAQDREVLRAENAELKRHLARQDDEIHALNTRVSDLTRSGVPGPPGKQGESGHVGARGATGPEGQTGHRGPQGEPGQTGQQGQAGEVGHAGQSGQDVYTTPPEER